MRATHAADIDALEKAHEAGLEAVRADAAAEAEAAAARQEELAAANAALRAEQAAAVERHADALGKENAQAESALQVILTPSHLLHRISPIFPPFFSVVCAFSPARRGGSNEPQAGTQGQETAGAGVQTVGNTVSPAGLTPVIALGQALIYPLCLGFCAVPCWVWAVQQPHVAAALGVQLVTMAGCENATAP